MRTSPLLEAAGAVSAWAGTAGSSASTTAGGSTFPVENDICTWSWVLCSARAAAGEPASPALRGRRIASRSTLLRPTRLSPSPPPLARGLDRSISPRSAWAGAGAGASTGSAGASPSAAIAMIGVPTGTISPSGTSSPVTVPA